MHWHGPTAVRDYRVTPVIGFALQITLTQVGTVNINLLARIMKSIRHTEKQQFSKLLIPHAG